MLYPAFAWSGFTSAFSLVVIGNRLQSGLGTVDSLFAVVLGCWLLFAYVAAIGFAAGRWGLNSQLMLEAVFGRIGAIIPGVLLAFLVAGWFAFHVVLTSTVLLRVMHIESGVNAAIAVIGLLFAAPVILEVSRGFRIAAVAFPAMLGFGGVVVATQIVPAWSTLLDGPLQGALPFGTGVCVAFGTFAVSGTMTGDIVRYCRTGNEAVQASAIGFLLSNLPFMLLGVLVGAANADVVDLLSGRGWVPNLLLAMVVLSNFAVCDACLANASITLKRVLPWCPWSIVAVVATMVAAFLAFSNVVSDVFFWTLFIASVVPPIGGVIIADYYVVRSRLGFSRARSIRVNLAALFALCVAAALSFYSWYVFESIFTPLIGVLLASLVYLCLFAVAPVSLGAGLGPDPLGAEAVD